MKNIFLLQHVRTIIVDKALFASFHAMDQLVNVRPVYWVIHSQEVTALPTNVLPLFHVPMAKLVLAVVANTVVRMLSVELVLPANHTRENAFVNRISLEIQKCFACHVSFLYIQ